jgi:hypothetical protein
MIQNVADVMTDCHSCVLKSNVVVVIVVVVVVVVGARFQQGLPIVWAKIPLSFERGSLCFVV